MKKPLRIASWAAASLVTVFGALAGVGVSSASNRESVSATQAAGAGELPQKRASAPLADYYRGTVVNNQLPDQKVRLELSIFQRSDSSTTGWLQSDAPLNTKGLTWLVDAEADEDSLYLVTQSAAGDTIVWASETRTGRIGGEYWVSAGRNVGKGGIWELAPAPRLSAETLALVAIICAGALLLGVFALVAYGAERWWSWRAKRPLDVTDEQRKRWSGIGGWLLWIMIGQSIVAISLIIRIGEVTRDLGDGWMLGAALDGMRPVLMIESGFHVFQLAGIVGGLVLMMRKSRMAPPYWMTFLVLMATYAVYDINATSWLRTDMLALFGPEISADFDAETASAARLNSRLAFWALVWTLYWARSRRVALVFAPQRDLDVDAAAPPDAAVPAGVKTDFSLTAAPPEPRVPRVPQ